MGEILEIMKKLKFSTFFLVVSLFSLSCENDNSIEIVKENSFNYGKTEVFLDQEKAIVNTGNIISDFVNNEIFISDNVYIKDGIINTKSRNKLWFIPFDKNMEPILMNKTDGGGVGDPTIEISCDCSSGTVGDCDTNETSTSSGSQIKCTGGCVNPQQPDVSGTCDMTVNIITGRKSFSFDAVNGIIISSKKIVFNNKLYN
ncbi:hypothetical protein [Corallibacter sp.]|uniref:hypothetical protein n=1 Tax=Corallibacter sp. TaxID=2038084 RepID=UPI003AB84208